MKCFLITEVFVENQHEFKKERKELAFSNFKISNVKKKKVCYSCAEK